MRLTKGRKAKFKVKVKRKRRENITERTRANERTNPETCFAAKQSK